MKTLSDQKIFKGVFSALPTPFKKNGEVDFNAYSRLIQKQIDSGISGIVPCGTTGESPVLTLSEKLKLFEVAISLCKNSKLLVIAGTGSNNTDETCSLSKKASLMGADACLVVTPYYNKPSQNGLIAHFTAVADSVKNTPIILYNVPSRTSVSMTASTVAKLSCHKNIFGIKEASGNMHALTEMRRAVKKINKKTEKPFYFLTGDDPSFWPFLANGGDGVISVASNLIPNVFRNLHILWEDRRVRTGLSLFEKAFPILTQLFIETNPVPLKYLLHQNKIMEQNVRLPLFELSSENKKILLKTWNALPQSIKTDRPFNK